MNSPKNLLGRSVALPLALFCLSFTRPLYAQDDPVPPSDPKPEAPPAEAKPAADDAKPKETEASAKVDVNAGVAPVPAAEAPPVVADVDPEREKAVSQIGIERLPGSAYPEPLPRGIKGGSLWLTMQGLQWPYMPMIAGKPATRIGISGSVWNDLSYARVVSSRKDVDGRRKRWLSQGRGVLRVTPTYSNRDGWFAQAQAEFVANEDTSIPSTNVTGTTDDLYVRFGKWNLFDLTVGRFQGWEVFHYGMGLDLNTLERKGAKIEQTPNVPNDIYTFSYLWDRQDSGLGYYALHVYPHKFVRFEVLGALGSGKAVNTDYEAGVRPVGILALGIVKLKAGFEYVKAIPQKDDSPPGAHSDRDTRKGYGAALQFVLNPHVEAGAAYARSFEDVRTNMNNDDIRGSNNTWTAGGFLNARVVGPFIVGGGMLKNHWENRNPNGKPGPDYGTVDYKEQFLSFFALQYTAFDTIYFKFVGSHAFFKDHGGDQAHASNNLLGGRFRMMVLF